MEPSILKININDDIVDKLENYIINTTNLDLYILNFNKVNFDFIEKFVYDMALFHLNNYNIELNHNHQIEFWIKNGNNYVNSLHFDCDEVLRADNVYEYPILSCVTYFDDSNYPFILTDIDVENYKYKNFDESKELYILFPNKYNHVSFNPKYYHGAINILDDKINNNRSLLAINIWDKKKDLKEYQSIEFKNIYTKKDSLIKIENNIEFNNYILNENLLDFDFYEILLYNTSFIKNIFPNIIIEYITEKIKEEQFAFKIINPIKSKEINLIEEKTSLENIDNAKNKIYQLENLEKNNLVFNRFLQRFTFENIYSQCVCNWIINESELYASQNGGWSSLRHREYPTTDIPIQKIQTIYNFIISTFENIFNKISKAYCLPDDTNYNIIDMFIVKYHHEYQNELELHHDGSFLSLNILLNDKKEFEGGGTFFFDGIISYLNQGEMIVHSGKIKHAGLPITKGIRYILVVFISIDDFV